MGFSIEFRIENNLRETGAIAEVNENQTSMVPPCLHPSNQNHFAPDQIWPRLTAIAASLPIAQGVVENSLHLTRLPRHQLCLDLLEVNLVLLFARHVTQRGPAFLKFIVADNQNPLRMELIRASHLAL